MSTSRTRVRPRAAAVLTALTLALLPVAPAGAVSTGPTGAVAGEGARQIPLQGAVNVRDLGGHLTYDGKRTRYGVAYRADALGRLTEADVATLAGLRLGKAVDFRIPLEVQQDGQDRLPPGVIPVPRPVTDNGLYQQLYAAIGSRDPVRQEEMLGGGRAAAFMRAVYPAFVNDPANRERFAATVRDVAAGGRAVLFHCTAGKDRTGWLSYVLLRAVGVPAATAERDYLASNGYRAAYDAKVREGLKQAGLMQNPDLIIPLQEVRDEYLAGALAEVERLYGGFGGYLTKGLGLEPQVLVALRAKLVE
ncbi:tyrosine-protein phosphatase [Streptomyces sp. NPDC050504]|uniref:tyrosine-protein phosphatase n=1 Tax=Streptomyces sp. NPDC050504 TaxID=3365618 RepID=UPI0037A79ABD